MALKKVRLELARSREFPDGSADRGYEFVAPIDEAGHLDAEEWRDNKEECTVHRFWRGQGDKFGRLVHRGQGWAVHYEEEEIEEGEEENDPFYKMDRHVLAVGEYVSLTEHDGETYTYKVENLLPY